MMSLNLVKLFFPAVLTFVIGILITPFFSDFFFKHKMWKKVARKVNSDGNFENEMSQTFQKINNHDAELRTPRVGGMIIWVSICLCGLILFLIPTFFPSMTSQKLNFLSFNQTLLPFIALMVGALIGLVNDLMTIYVTKGVFMNGFPRKYMLSLIFLSALVFALWFFLKLDVNSIVLPFKFHELYLGIWFVPFFVFIFLATFSSGVIDGIDGLAGGIMAIIFASLAVISFFQNQIDIAAFCLVVSGAILAFLWFNIPPARFWMGETGMLGLLFTLAVVVFLTNTVFILPIIGFPLVATALSSLIQILGKKWFGPVRGKVFRVAPLHHHFEAIGWSREKITMRYWIISFMFAVVGVIVAVL